MLVLIVTRGVGVGRDDTQGHEEAVSTVDCAEYCCQKDPFFFPCLHLMPSLAS